MRRPNNGGSSVALTFGYPKSWESKSRESGATKLKPATERSDIFVPFRSIICESGYAYRFISCSINVAKYFAVGRARSTKPSRRMRWTT